MDQATSSTFAGAPDLGRAPLAPPVGRVPGGSPLDRSRIVEPRLDHLLQPRDPVVEHRLDVFE
jgi:hypothetical protein